MTDLRRLGNLAELEAAARKVLPRGIYDFIAGGAEDEVTWAENVAAFRRLRLRPRVLVDVSRRDLSTTVLGAPLALPVLIAPMALHRLVHPDGELASARAVAALGTTMLASTASSFSLEEIAAAYADDRRSTSADVPSSPIARSSRIDDNRMASSPHHRDDPDPAIVRLPSSVLRPPLWFQLYIYRDRELTRSLVERARAAGYGALCLTVDTPVIGQRERDVRNTFAFPPGVSFANFATGEARGEVRLQPVESSEIAAYVNSQFDPALTWADVDWLRGIWNGPIALKGILHREDARLALDHGVDAVIVSNHGGRQLDGALATVEALPAIVAAVDGRVEVILDGGVRRGADVLKALALGARACLVGRPFLWGIAIGGVAGGIRALEILRNELDRALALTGRPSVRELTADLVYGIGAQA